MTKKEDLFSREEITDSDAEFILNLYDAILSLVKEDRMVSLKNISMIVRVPTTELYDFLPEILDISRKINEEQVR